MANLLHAETHRDSGNQKEKLEAIFNNPDKKIYYSKEYKTDEEVENWNFLKKMAGIPRTNGICPNEAIEKASLDDIRAYSQ